jgi:hypothetical protein
MSVSIGVAFFAGELEDSELDEFPLLLLESDDDSELIT